MEATKNPRQGFVDKFAGAFTCHAMSLKKDKKRPMLDAGSSPESESVVPVTGVKKILADHKKGFSFVDILKPTSRADLLTHPKKIEEIVSWLHLVSERRSSSQGRGLFLILSGPSGSGKLTTLDILAKERGMDLIEFSEVAYINGIFTDDNDSNHYSDQIYNRSQIDNVRNFLIQANITSLVNKKPKNKRLIVMKDLPFTLVKEPEKYHKLWTWYKEEFGTDGVPVIFIISCDPGRDQVKLFPSQLREQLNLMEISFNPIVKTRMSKWLVEKLEKKVSKPDIDAIVEGGNGDIRNVLNCFELKFSQSMIKQQSFSHYKRNAKRPRTEGDSSKESKSRAIWGRDASLELYHFLGKILYSKRDFEKPMRKTLPDSLKRYERHSLNEDPFQLYESYDLSPSTLNLFLHQNYLAYAENLESAANSIEWLSQVDCLRDDVYDSDSPLEKYQSCLSIAGTMFNLSPNGPVKVKHFEDKHAKRSNSHDSRRSAISSNRGWHLTREKIKENRSLLKHAFNHKSTSLVTQDLVLDMLPYVSMMKGPKKSFNSDLLKLSLFPKLTSGCYYGSQEHFSQRLSSIQLTKDNSDLAMGNLEESDDDDDARHYIIDDDSPDENN